MQVTLTKVQRYTTGKDSKPLINSNGKPYVRVLVKTQEHGDATISGFGNRDNENWQEGDRVDIEVEQKGEYLNFKMPPKKEADMSGFMSSVIFEINELKAKVKALEDWKKSF